MERGQKLYEGKAKIVYATSDPGVHAMHFKDDATAMDGQKKGSIRGKGEVNARISSVLFKLLEEVGIKTHYLGTQGENDLLVQPLQMYGVEFVVRNVVAGSLARRLGLDEGLQLLQPVLETYYKNDDLNDPLVNQDHIRLLDLMDQESLETCSMVSRQVNLVLRNFFQRRGLLLVDFKLEFGHDGRQVVLGDEISPDTCRFWDAETGEKLDKDRFRRDLGGVEEAYREVMGRVTGEEE